MIAWSATSPESTYQAALSYLTTRYGERVAYILVAKLRHSTLRAVAAKDILRAARLDPLPPGEDNPQGDTTGGGGRYPPVFVIRTRHGADIADGYHRVSLAYNQHPTTLVPVRDAELRFGPDAIT